jgi:hypothetical protein
MSTDLPDSLERFSHSDLIAAMRDLLGAFAQLQSKHEELSGAFAKLRIEHQAVKDELARHKKLPPRPLTSPNAAAKAFGVLVVDRARRASDAPSVTTLHNCGQLRDAMARRRGARRDRRRTRLSCGSWPLSAP